MKHLLILVSLLVTSPAFAQTKEVTKQKVYRPFTYETACALETPQEFQVDTCKVVETRESTGALRTRISSLIVSVLPSNLVLIKKRDL